MNEPDPTGESWSPGGKTLLPESTSFPAAVMVATPNDEREREFLADLRALLNRTGMDSQCGTPDFVLAELVLGHLRAFRHARIALAGYEGRTVRQVG